jgi:hypothetical protein
MYDRFRRLNLNNTSKSPSKNSNKRIENLKANEINIKKKDELHKIKINC